MPVKKSFNPKVKSLDEETASESLVISAICKISDGVPLSLNELRHYNKFVKVVNSNISIDWNRIKLFEEADERALELWPSFEKRLEALRTNNSNA